MISAIREVRRAKGLTLDDVAQRCKPPTTPQTIGRLECGTRTVSLPWLRRIAAALEVEPADLVKLPDRVELPMTAVLDASGARAPASRQVVLPPTAYPGMTAVVVWAGVGEYRSGDEIWCEPLTPDRFPEALNRDVLVPRQVGRFVFGRLIAMEPGEKLLIMPPGPGARQQVAANPPWIARAVRLVRAL